MRQIEISGFEINKLKTIILECECRKKDKVQVICQPGIDERFFVGKCPKCEKQLYKKRSE